MSGLDEQNVDVMPCSCKDFRYWVINSKNSRLGYLNPDAWMESDFIMSVNRATFVGSISKDEFISRIANFCCETCLRIVKKGDDIFEHLCSNVRIRWDMDRPYLSNGDI